MSRVSRWGEATSQAKAQAAGSAPRARNFSRPAAWRGVGVAEAVIHTETTAVSTSGP